MVFLDTNLVIYFIEQPPIWGAKTTARIAALLASDERLAINDLVRMECQVGPLKAGDHLLLNKFHIFFASPDVQVLALTSAICDGAARIRALYNFKPLDSLHLATAVEAGCTLFLTNDAALARFPDIRVEVLT
jgi:uncharacterized protein